MKKWEYIHFNKETGVVPIDKKYKEPYVWREASPGEDYLDVTENEDLIEMEADKYPQRIKDGLKFSAIMNAELGLMGVNNFTSEDMAQLKDSFGVGDLEVVEMAKDAIAIAFEKVQWFIEGGKWISAKREISRSESTAFVKQALIDRMKLDIDNYIAISY